MIDPWNRINHRGENESMTVVSQVTLVLQMDNMNIAVHRNPHQAAVLLALQSLK